MVELDKALEEALNVPVVDPVVAAVKFLEALLGYGKKTSKISFRLPDRLR
jgi:Asp/Glu/hydantoin racemase